MPTAKIVKPTTKNSSPMRTGHARDNKPAEAYAPPHTMSGGKVTADAREIEVKRNPNTLSAMEVSPRTKAMSVSVGNSGADDVKTTGIEMRGAGAATKGRMSRGPMA
jgi:hypothetical protein